LNKTKGHNQFKDSLAYTGSILENASLGGTSVNFGFSANKNFFQNNPAIQAAIAKAREEESKEKSTTSDNNKITSNSALASVLGKTDQGLLKEVGLDSS
jgi:hypothetical protein